MLTKSVCLLIISAMLVSCGITQQARYQEAWAESEKLTAGCVQKYKTAEKLKFITCINSAEKRIASFSPWPDLWQLKWAQRAALAAKVDKHLITSEEAALEDARTMANLTSEYERRMLAHRSVNAQEDAAAALYRGGSLGVGHNCTAAGGAVFCY